MVGVDGECTAAQCGEVDDRGGDLRADAFELLEPRADLVRAIAVQEVERERAGACGDLFERRLEADSLLLREGDDGDGALDLRHGGIANGLPVTGAGAGERTFEVAHHLKDCAVLVRELSSE